MLNNREAPLTPDQWNQTLRKAQVFNNSFARKKIRSQSPSSFEDKVMGHHASWKKDEQIKLKDIQILKLYTDFDSLQKALKKCLRFNCIVDILAFNRIDDDEVNPNDDRCDRSSCRRRYEKACDVPREKRRKLEYLLSDFHHWKGSLMIILTKFSQKVDKDMTLYHGVDTKMIIAANKTLSFYGPLSTTSSEHIAKTFATAKGT